MLVGRYRLVESWSRAEWERLTSEARPKGAIRFGDGWVLLTEEPTIGRRGKEAPFPASEPLEDSRGVVPGPPDASGA